MAYDSTSDDPYRNNAKWTSLLMDAGWTAVPSLLIERQDELGLDALDMNIILHLASYWWRADNLPHPSVQRIACAIGVTARTVQKRIAALERDGLITRIQRRHTRFGSNTNLYSFDGLIAALQPFAEHKARLKDERQVYEAEWMDVDRRARGTEGPLSAAAAARSR
jgi:hypothetical protein